MKKILVVEDDMFLGEVLVQKLSNKNFDVRLIRDGELAIKEMQEFKPDLVLLDILLPNVNGYEILEAKKADKEIVDIPVIIISNSGQPVEISRAVNLGIKDYLIKALFDPEEVLEKVFKQIGDGSDEKKK